MLLYVNVVNFIIILYRLTLYVHTLILVNFYPQELSVGTVINLSSQSSQFSPCGLGD